MRSEIQPTWIVVANGHRARILVSDARSRRWTPYAGLEHPQSRAKVHELVTDDRGRARQSATGARPAMEPEHSPKEVEMDRFAHLIAKFLEHGLDTHQYAAVTIIAPPKFLGRLRARLSDRVADRVSSVVEKDYTALDAYELERRLAA
jgi:protein required for attachment to host cells